MTLAWPWPDDRQERTHRIAHMYRAIARTADPRATGELDAVMRGFGESWIVDGFMVDADRLLTAREIADLSNVSPGAVRQWVARWPLARHGVNDDGHPVYRWGDVLDRRKAKRAARQR